MTIFRSAIIKLTLLYLLIIMSISIFFSLILYRASDSEILTFLIQQQDSVMRLGQAHDLVLLPNAPFQAERDVQLSEIRNRLIWELIYANIFIFLGGGILSYWLAVFNIRPLEESNKSQVRFASEASHELRSPLAAMKSELEVAIRDPNLTEVEAKEILASNLEEVERLSSLTDNLLEFTKKPTRKFELINIPEVVEEAIAKIDKKIKEHNITIDKKNVSNVRIYADRTQMLQLFIILLENSIKYSKWGKKITISVIKTAHHGKIIIRDQGMGIDAKDLPHIFDRFYRSALARSQKDEEGYGLGLAIAKRIVDIHKGTITAASTVGKGTEFTIKFPLASQGA